DLPEDAPFLGHAPARPADRGGAARLHHRPRCRRTRTGTEPGGPSGGDDAGGGVGERDQPALRSLSLFSLGESDGRQARRQKKGAKVLCTTIPLLPASCPVFLRPRMK